MPVFFRLLSVRLSSVIFSPRRRVRILLLPVFCLLFSALPAPCQIGIEISPSEFTQLVLSMSEDAGYFFSDNWVPNEPNYWRICKDIERLKLKGGVYIGVAQDQNFGYIAKIKPEVAFIVDIRQLNRYQHLVIKALFEFAETPAEFFSLLFSKEIDASVKADGFSDIGEIVSYLRRAPSNRDIFWKTVDDIIELYRNKYAFPVNDDAECDIIYILSYFYKFNLDIGYFGHCLPDEKYLTYEKFLMLKDFDGHYVTPFSNIEDYTLLRNMQLENRIIPITGDFTGKKAFQEIGEFMRERNLTLSAFYVSNVEEKIFYELSSERPAFQDFVDNIRLLPSNDYSVIIRVTNMLSKFTVNYNRCQLVRTFLDNAVKGKYSSYHELIDTGRDYIEE